MPVATGNEEREPVSWMLPLNDERWPCDGLDGTGTPIAGLEPKYDAEGGPGAGEAPGLPAVVAACGTMSGFGMVVPTDCFGARPALESA